MRKKTVLLILLSMLLCGCGADVQPFAAADAAELVSAGAFPGSDMAELDGEILLMLYGIEEETVIECAGFVAANTSISADEAAVFVLKDEAAAVTAEAACRKRVEAQLAMCRDYCPDAVPRLTDAAICRRGNTVLLAVGDAKWIAEWLAKR